MTVRYQGWNRRCGKTDVTMIPFARTDCDDTKVWKGEPSGEFTVRSAYKLLQEANLDSSNYLLQADTKDFYRKLWNLQLPTKILIFIWRISWNYIPSLVNLRSKRVTTIARCPRGCSAEEDSLHVFRQCPVSTDAWISLNMAWVTEHTDQSAWTWLTWVFSRGTKQQIRIFCYALWVIWNSRNQMLHEKKISSGRDLAFKVQNFLIELEGVRERKLTTTAVRSEHREEELWESIQFDATFDINNSISASRMVVRGQNGEIAASKSTLHSNVSSPYVVEALACLEATNLGISMGLNSVTVMGDSKTIIKKCKMGVRDKSVLGAIIVDIQNNKTRFQRIVFRYIQRAENVKAHDLAKEALRKGEGSYLVEETRETLDAGGRWPRNPN
ncbi:uncharacterized protein [Gossypium hirsutum]|uniref:Reverse transcriptase n=1 Tax=Gossypium hirsutum TaxID=3635 RepID=A0ABM3ABV7_GOSHI|nr:uncharacterized protein LOC121218720 [Gossypium hirsutum]